MDRQTDRVTIRQKKTHNDKQNRKMLKLEKHGERNRKIKQLKGYKQNTQSSQSHT